MHEKVDTFMKANNIGEEELFSFFFFSLLPWRAQVRDKTKISFKKKCNGTTMGSLTISSTKFLISEWF